VVPRCNGRFRGPLSVRVRGLTRFPTISETSAATVVGFGNTPATHLHQGETSHTVAVSTSATAAEHRRDCSPWNSATPRAIWGIATARSGARRPRCRFPTTSVPIYASRVRHLSDAEPFLDSAVTFTAMAADGTATSPERNTHWAWATRQRHHPGLPIQGLVPDHHDRHRPRRPSLLRELLQSLAERDLGVGELRDRVDRQHAVDRGRRVLR